MIKGTTECTNKVTFIHITYCSSNEGNFREIQSMADVYKGKEREREGEVPTSNGVHYLGIIFLVCDPVMGDNGQMVMGSIKKLNNNNNIIISMYQRSCYLYTKRDLFKLLTF